MHEEAADGAVRAVANVQEAAAVAGGHVRGEEAAGCFAAQRSCHGAAETEVAAFPGNGVAEMVPLTVLVVKAS